MPLVIPTELKKITPYVRRAEELDKDKANAESRLVAFYSRQYAVHVGIDLATSVTGKTCLGELLSALETEKIVMDSFTREEAKFLCRKFADKIFDKADLEDRTGEATKDTAKTFYAAASFLEILNQFYKMDDDSEEIVEIRKRAVYGKWKATEILKAIKEGRQPTPGGYGEDDPVEEEEVRSTSNGVVKNNLTPQVVQTVESDDEEKIEGPTEPEGPVVRMPSEEKNNGKGDDDEDDDEKEEEGTEVELGPPPVYDFIPPPVVPFVTPTPSVKPPIKFTPPPQMSSMPPPSTTQPNPPPTEKKPRSGIFGFGKKNKSRLSKAEFGDAMELTKFALAALEEKNADLAAERLQLALNVLGQR